jgi:hypothetical protein
MKVFAHSTQFWLSTILIITIDLPQVSLEWVLIGYIQFIMRSVLNLKRRTRETCKTRHLLLSFQLKCSLNIDSIHYLGLTNSFDRKLINFLLLLNEPIRFRFRTDWPIGNAQEVKKNLNSYELVGFYYIPGVLCQCPRSQLVLSAVHDDNIECFLKSWCLKENILFFCLF